LISKLHAALASVSSKNGVWPVMKQVSVRSAKHDRIIEEADVATETKEFILQTKR
jgi:hypothetical protein